MKSLINRLLSIAGLIASLLLSSANLPAALPSTPPAHIVILVEENKPASAITASNAPTLTAWKNSGANFTQYHGVANSGGTAHPSQPSYFQFYAGSDQGIGTSDACPPAGSQYTTENLGHQFLSSGRTFIGYGESMPSQGSLTCSSGNYLRRHCPWISWQGTGTNQIPSSVSKPFPANFSTMDYNTLPTLTIVIPNTLHDIHGSPITDADTWANTNLSNYVAFAQNPANNSLFIVIFDEDGSGPDPSGTVDPMLAFFVGGMVQSGSYSEHINHYCLLRTIEDLYGFSHVANAASATTITDCWTSGGGTPSVSIAASIANASEPGTNGQFTLTASPAPASPITVNVSVTGTATNGTDYASIASTVTISTSGTATVPVTVIDDSLVEGSETVILTVQSGTGYTVGSPSAATVTIADDDSGSGVGPFTAEDIGSPAIAGSASLAGGVYTIAGAGTDIFNTSDQFQFAHEAWNGDGTIVARVTQVQNTHNFAKAGVMFRDGLAANAAHVMNTLTAASGVQLLHRATTGGTTTSDFTIAGFSAPYWIRLDRHGSTFTGYDSPDGLTWFLTGSVSFTLPTATQVGLAVTSHNAAALNTSKFDNVSVSSLPSWTSADVGTTGAAGSASINYATGVYTVTGSGADIFGGTDAFQYYYQTWTGDAVLIAEVKTEQNTQNYAKAGIMIRKSLAANSAHALIDLTPGPNGAEFNRRLADGNATTAQSTSPGLHAPYFIKLTRSGDNFTAYTSPDGGTWTQLGPVESIPMGAGSVFAGLVVCSHVAGTLNTSTFDSVFFAP